MTATDSVLANIDRRLGDLQSGRAAHLSDAEREAAYRREMLELGRRQSVIRTTTADLAGLEPKISAVETWVAHLTTWRIDFAKDLASLPSAADPSVAVLKDAIEQIDFGCQIRFGAAVIAAPLREKICATYPASWDGPRDPWAVGFGGFGEAQHRLSVLVAKRDAMQAQLDAALRESTIGTAPVVTK